MSDSFHYVGKAAEVLLGFCIFGFFTLGIWDFFYHNMFTGILLFITFIPFMALSLIGTGIGTAMVFSIGSKLMKKDFEIPEIEGVIIGVFSSALFVGLSYLFFSSDVPFHWFYGYMWAGIAFFCFVAPIASDS